MQDIFFTFINGEGFKEATKQIEGGTRELKGILIQWSRGDFLTL